MTPVANTASGQAAMAVAQNMAQDRDGVAVLNEDGIIQYTGAYADACEYMEANGLRPHCNCELVDLQPGYMVGFEAY